MEDGLSSRSLTVEPNGLQVHQIKADLFACHQKEGHDIATYFGKLKAKWDSLDHYEPEIGCCCQDSACPILLSHRKRRTHERIHQFLIGLDVSRFGTIRANLLACLLTRGKDLSMDQIYSELS